MRVAMRLTAVAGVLALTAGAASAAPTPTSGTTKIVIKDNATCSKRKTVFLTKDINITIPSPSPDVTGANMRLLNPATNQTSSVWNMPASLWVCTPGKVCKYKDKLLANGPVLTAVLKPGDGVKKNGLFKAVAKGCAMDYVLINNGTQGHVGVVVNIGSGGVCTLVPEQAGVAKKDDPVKGQFIAARTKGTPPDGSCPSVGAGTTTTTTSAPTTTTTLLFDFTTDVPNLISCTSGHSFDATVGGSVLKDLHCGGLNIGGGPSTVAEGATPENATSRFKATCSGSACTLSATTAPGANFECTNTGCNFGPPLPIKNAGTSTCVINTFSSPGSGTIDTSNGSGSTVVPLASHVFLTGNSTAPCPRCVAGHCERGPNSGAVCTTTNSFMTTKQCGSDGTDLGNIAVDLTPLQTGLASKTDAGGEFCPGQATPTNPSGNDKMGCFGSTACQRIEEQGVASVAIVVNAAPVASRLATVFCVPETPGGLGQLINLAAGLPGPGATSLPGFVSLHN